MPKCSSVTAESPFSGGNRAANLVLRIGGISRRIHLGGVASATFPNLTDEQFLNLSAGQSFSFEWEDAAFCGFDSLLGPISAVLRPREEAGIVHQGKVRSINSINDASENKSAFFPAINRNSLFFRLSCPRFNLIFDSANPIINEALINQIPPIGPIYKLANPVKFTPVRRLSGFISSITPPATIETCGVKLILHGGVSIQINVINETEETVSFEASIQNETETPLLQASWMVWPRPEMDTDNWMGFIKLTTKLTSISFTLPRDIFFRARWLAVSVAEPFETNAAAAARFPPLS